MIPKASGKLRKLGIPTVADRVVQAALKLVLEPIFEADFQPCSYGFRPNRRAQDAIAEIHYFATQRIPVGAGGRHRGVFRRDRPHRADGPAPGEDQGQAGAGAGQGVPQGRGHDGRPATGRRHSPAPRRAGSSPRCWPTSRCPRWTTFHPAVADADGHRAGSGQNAGRKGLGNWRLIRYADDFVIIVTGTRHHAEALREEVAAVLAPLGLRLAEEKTRVVHIDEGFDFLGFTIRRMRKRGTSKHYVYTYPSRKAIQAIKDKVSAKTYRSTLNQDLDGSSRAQPGPGRVGELLPARRVQGRLQRDRLLRMEPDHALAAAQTPRTHRTRDARTPAPVLPPRHLALAPNGIRFTGASASRSPATATAASGSRPRGTPPAHTS